MYCPEDSELALWADGLLSATRAEAIREHMGECLHCRLVVGDPAAEARGHSPAAESPGQSHATPADALDRAALAAIPPFETIKGRLAASFWGGSEQAPPFAGDLSFQDDLVLMAADTEKTSDAITIPSLYAEDGRLVVTFRANREGLVTAFFVSEEPERVRFRALKVGRRCYVTDLEGRAVLSGMASDEVLGQEIAIPPVVATVDATRAVNAAGETAGINTTGAAYVPGTGKALEARLELPHPSAGTTPASVYVRMESSGARPMWTIHLENPPPEMHVLIAVIGERAAHVLPRGAGGEADGDAGGGAGSVAGNAAGSTPVLTYDAEPTDRVRIQMIDLS
jgi:hypothetical protein